MARKFVEYEIMKTGEIIRKYEDTNKYLFDMVLQLFDVDKLPYTLRDGEVKILKVGEDG